jgi:hypothetical protein
MAALDDQASHEPTRFDEVVSIRLGGTSFVFAFVST